MQIYKNSRENIHREIDYVQNGTEYNQIHSHAGYNSVQKYCCAALD